MVVTSVSGESISREYYRVIDEDGFVYTIPGAFSCGPSRTNLH